MVGYFPDRTHMYIILIMTNNDCLFDLVEFYGISYCRLFNVKSIFIHINSPISSNSVWYKYTQFTSIWPVDRTLSGDTTLGQSGPGSNGNEGVLCIPLISGITEASSSDCLVSYSRYFGGLLPRDAVSVFCCPSWLCRFYLLFFFLSSFSTQWVR